MPLCAVGVTGAAVISATMAALSGFVGWNFLVIPILSRILRDSAQDSGLCPVAGRDPAAFDRGEVTTGGRYV